MTNTILKTLILSCLVGIILSCLATDVTYPQGSVIADSDNVEIHFVPTHSLYQKRCLVDGQLVYCARTDVLSTVSVDHDNVEIDFIADAE